MHLPEDLPSRGPRVEGRKEDGSAIPGREKAKVVRAPPLLEEVSSLLGQLAPFGFWVRRDAAKEASQTPCGVPPAQQGLLREELIQEFSGHPGIAPHEPSLSGKEP